MKQKKHTFFKNATNYTEIEKLIHIFFLDFEDLLPNDVMQLYVYDGHELHFCIT